MEFSETSSLLSLVTSNKNPNVVAVDARGTGIEAIL
jgi:hypothetical protein